MDDPFWERALGELNAGRPDAALWAQCLDAAKGNKSIAEMQYLRDRAKQLADEQAELQRRKRQDEEDAQLSQAMRIVEGLPKGACSNCQAVVLLMAQTCPKCAVRFEPGGRHQVVPGGGAKKAAR